MSRKTVVEAGAVIFTLGILASPAGAEPLKLADAQMDNLTAGAFQIFGTPTAGSNFTLSGQLNGVQNLAALSTDGGLNYTVTAADGTITNWEAQALYISTTQGFAVGVLFNSQTGQYWDGQLLGPAGGIVMPTQTRGVLITTPVG